MRAPEFITGHVIYNPAYTYNFQLKTTFVGKGNIFSKYILLFVMSPNYLTFLFVSKIALYICINKKQKSLQTLFITLDN